MAGENSAILRLDSVLSAPRPRSSAFASHLQRELDVLLATIAAAFIAVVCCLGLALLLSWLWMYEPVDDYALAVAVPVMAVAGATLLAATMRRMLSVENKIGSFTLFFIGLAAHPLAWIGRGWAQDPTFPSWGLDRCVAWVIATRATELADLGVPLYYYLAAEAVVTAIGGVALAHWYATRRAR